jgi:hypothetical protein
MTKHYQRGDAGVAMVIVMVVVMIGFFWHGGMGHGSDRAGHMSTASEAAKSPLDRKGHDDGRRHAEAHGPDAQADGRDDERLVRADEEEVTAIRPVR